MFSSGMWWGVQEKRFPCLLLQSRTRDQGSSHDGVELVRALGLAPERIQESLEAVFNGGAAEITGPGGDVTSAAPGAATAAGASETVAQREPEPVCAGPKVMVSIKISASRILYNVDIRPSSSATLSASREQLTQSDGEVRGAIC